MNMVLLIDCKKTDACLTDKNDVKICSTAHRRLFLHIQSAVSCAFCFAQKNE